jgi:hypothetical protein
VGYSSFSDVFFAGLDVLSVALDEATNVLTAMLGDGQSTSGAVDSPKAEIWFPIGFAAVPAPPTPGKPSAQACGIRQGDVDIVLGFRDARNASRTNNLKPGDSMLYSTVSAAKVGALADGTVAMFTTDDGTPTGKATWFTLGPDGFHFLAPWGQFDFDVSGWRVRHAGGFTLQAGGIGGLPGPLAALASYFNVSASMQKYQGALVLLGNGPVYNPAVWVAAENPLTTPGNSVGITAAGFGAPIFAWSSTSVRISGTPTTG